MTNQTTAIKRLEQPHLLSLPDGLLNYIGFWLGQKDECSLELVSRKAYASLSTGPGNGQLDFHWNGEIGRRRVSADAFRSA